MHKKACRSGIFMQRRLMQSLIYMREWKGLMAWTFVHKVLTVMQLITGTQINWLLIRSKMTCDGRHLAENNLFGTTMRDDDDLLFDETHMALVIFCFEAILNFEFLCFANTTDLSRYVCHFGFASEFPLCRKAGI